jgi:hypothetical protein
MFLLCGVAGCGVNITPVPPDDNDPGSELVDGNRDDSLRSPLGKTAGEPNDTFADPIVAVFDENGAAAIQGTVAEVGDLDVYLLGELSAGTELIVDASTQGSALDVSVAVFDGDQQLVYNNDDRETPGDRFLDSYIEWLVRHDSERYYLVVTNSPFAQYEYENAGSYAVDIRVSTGFEVPDPVGQTLLLDFDGGVVNSPVLGSMTLGPFDAALISPIYEGQTETVKDAIRSVFEQNYERFNVTILTTDDPPPRGMSFSTIYFGGLNYEAFGIAEDVDLYNADYSDDALIFTETFSPGQFSEIPTATEIGVAIGNIASHEAGHLLGLNHVDDDWELMDDQSAADAFLLDQEFDQAPLSSDIMPIGYQDAPLLLFEAVGPSVPPPQKSVRIAIAAHRPSHGK